MSSLEINSTTADGIRSEKQKLRKEIRAKIRLLPVDELKRQSEMVWDNLARLDEYKSAKTVGLFLSMPTNEIDTRGILKRSIEEDGKVVYVPRVGLDFEHCDMGTLLVFSSKEYCHFIKSQSLELRLRR